jgi:putative transposase
MPRTARGTCGGIVQHVLNRGNGKMKVFHKPGDYDAFLRLLAQAQDHARVELLGYCLMPNHWHLVLKPKGDGDLSRFMGWLTTAHVRRHHAHYRSGGGGHLYQGRYKSFPVQDDYHLLTVLRYVEANALRAGLCERPAGWRWSSCCPSKDKGAPILSEWPVDRPTNWLTLLQRDLPESELESLRQSVVRGRPFGDANWVARTAKRLGLEFTLRSRGRPKLPENTK